MSERDELAVTITLSLDAIHGIHNGIPAVQDYELADAILAAGYRKPQQVTTVEELDALPVGSVVRTSGTDEYQPRVAVKLSDYNGSDWDVADCDEFAVMSSELDDLPATVLHVGGAE